LNCLGFDALRLRQEQSFMSILTICGSTSVIAQIDR
jgi:hypothetical protein